MRWIIVVLSLSVLVSNVSAQASARGTLDVPYGYELELEPQVASSPFVRRHKLARRAGIIVIPSLVLSALGAVGVNTCSWDGDYPGTCMLPLALVAMGGGAALISGGVFVYATNRLSRELRASGVSISRARGIVAAIFYGLPYLQPVGLILAARQARLNRIALQRIEDESPHYW